MKHFSFFALFLCWLQSSYAQYASSPDGMQWQREQVLYDANTLYPANEAWAKKITQSVDRHENSCPQGSSPNLKHYFVNITKAQLQPSNRPAIPFREYVMWYNARAYADKYYALAVLDDGRILSTDPTFKKKTYSFNNLYLADPSTGKQVLVYTGEVADNNPNTLMCSGLYKAIVSPDNSKIAVLTKDSQIIIDVQQGNAINITIPQQTDGGRFLGRDQAFFANTSEFFCVAGYVFKSDSPTSQAQNCLMAFDCKTGAHISTFLSPRMNGGWGAPEYRQLKDKVYAFDNEKNEYCQVEFSNQGIKRGAAVTWDTTVLDAELRNKYYYRHLMTTPEGSMLALVPSNQLSVNGYAYPMFLISLETGRLHSSIPFIEDTRAQRQKAIDDAKAQVALNAIECAKFEKIAASYADLSFDNAKGRMYILGYDCSQKGFVVGYLKAEQFYGNSGRGQYMPHSNVVLSIMSPGWLESTYISSNGKKYARLVMGGLLQQCTKNQPAGHGSRCLVITGASNQAILKQR